MYYLLIRGMTSLGLQNGVPIVCTLMCMFTLRIGPTVSHDIRLSSSYDFTKLLHYIVFNIEIILTLCRS